MANLLSLHLHSPSTAFTRRTHHSNYEIALRRSTVLCYASRSGRFRFRSEEEELFKAFGFGNNKKKKPWWLDDDDDDDDVMNDEDDDLSLVFDVFRSLSWMLAPIGMSLLLGTDTNAGLMALAVPLLQSLFSLVFDKVLSRPSVRPMRRTSVRRRKVRREENTVKEGGYKSWIDDDNMSSGYGGWDDLDTSNENVRSEQRFERKSSSRRLWRVKEKPLLLRMIFAAFPFLSSWNKLLF